MITPKTIVIYNADLKDLPNRSVINLSTYTTDRIGTILEVHTTAWIDTYYTFSDTNYDPATREIELTVFHLSGTSLIAPDKLVGNVEISYLAL